jgi:hypothetical protein
VALRDAAGSGARPAKRVDVPATRSHRPWWLALTGVGLLGAGVIVVLATRHDPAPPVAAPVVEPPPRGGVIEGGWGPPRAAREHAGEASLVVCNPPYVEPGRGRAASHPSRARARSGELDAFDAAACTLAGRRAHACFVYPARELTTLLAAFRRAGLEPKRMRAVRAHAESAARVVLVESVRGKPGGLVIEPDLIERRDAGYSPELEALLAAKPISREADRA